MSEKQTKKLRRMSRMFFQSQPPNMPDKKSQSEIFNELKQIHKNKINGLRISSSKTNK